VSSRDRGSVTAPLLLAIVALCLIVVAAGAIGAASLRLAGRLTPGAPDPTPVARRILALLASDPTPESDSPLDPVHARLEASGDGRLALEDISSAVDPNWVERSLLERTDLGSLLLAPGADADALQSYRVQAGLSVDVATHYRAFFRPEAFDRYLTGYQPANVNTTDELVLELLHREVAPAGDAIAFRQRIRQARAEALRFGTEDLPGLLAPLAAGASSSFSAAPCWNVHFLPEALLRDLVCSRAYSIADADAKAQALVEARAARELRPDELPALLGVPAEHPIFTYLGTRTWFWRASWESKGWRTAIVVARRSGANGEPSFAVVSVAHERVGKEGS